MPERKWTEVRAQTGAQEKFPVCVAGGVSNARLAVGDIRGCKKDACPCQTREGHKSVEEREIGVRGLQGK